MPLLVGSGVTPANIAMYGRHAHGVIAGSYVKRDGYWENPLDEERLARLASAAGKAGFEAGQGRVQLLYFSCCFGRNIHCQRQLLESGCF